MNEMIAKILAGAEEMGVSLPSDFGEQMTLFLSELLRWNTFMNLTAITDPDEMATKHVLDSLTLLTTGLIGGRSSVLDVGCGAGFPSMPLKLACPSLRVTFLDGVNKKLNFLRETAEKLELRDSVFLHGRAEELARGKTHRERYDIVTSRAVAALPALCEYCLPLVKVGGYFLAMKGPNAGEELESALGAIAALGGTLAERKETPVPFTDLTHNLIIIKKERPTPKQYPRQSAKIAQAPLTGA